MSKATSAASISFGSDNHSGVHPQILEAMFASEVGTSNKYAPSYDTDSDSAQLKEWIQKNWGAVDSHLVFNGTAANVLALAAAVRSHHAIICSDISHLNMDECGAPEKFVGAKLVSIPHKNGKIPLAELSSYLLRRGDQHASQIKMVSITQPTEFGTVYSLDELQTLREFCNKEKLFLHIDGARLGNACAHLKCEFKDILQYADVASVGGTKNGLLFGELVVIMNDQLNHEFKFLRKQAMQLPSKTRFMARAFLTYLDTRLWSKIATHQCGLAQYLAEQLAPVLTVNYPVESNAVFCCIPKNLIKALREDFFFYVWDELTFECRLMTSFCTTQEEIDLFVTKLKTILSRGAL